MREHWEHVYATKGPSERSWTQAVPATSLRLIHSLNLPKTAAIIDIGGGDSNLVDCLLDEGFEDLTVLDISSKAIEAARHRLGKRAAFVKWIVSDINAFEPDTTYELWHDRAAFHFLTSEAEIDRYILTATRCISEYLIVATFSTQGPTKCSGLPIHQYDERMLAAKYSPSFDVVDCIKEDHTTPFDTKQNFLFCCFKKKGS